MESSYKQEHIFTEKDEKQKPIATVHYRGYDINVYNDDYGQCFYFYFNDSCIGCGTYNPDYQGYIQYEIDNYLDNIEYIHNERPHHPSGLVKWVEDSTTGQRKKVLEYDFNTIVLDCQDGDYHDEVKRIMAKIDDEYDELHKGEKPRTFISDLMKENSGDIE